MAAAFSQDTGLALSAINTYFNSERRELLAMLVGAVLLICATGWLVFVARDGFARGLFGAVLVFGGVFGGGAVSLLLRDAGLRTELTAAMTGEPTKPLARMALSAEKARVEVVLSKFSAYRFAAVLIAVLALAGLLLSREGWAHGVAAGLLLVAASQALIDHYSEKRAAAYLQRLAAVQAVLESLAGE